ncbi:MAG: hypothetical protein NVS3B20_04600 [Polyangiales bacterium]
MSAFGCGAVTDLTQTSIDAAADGTGLDATTTDTATNPCPPTMPADGAPCALPGGSECTFDASKIPCGKVVCSGGKWARQITPLGCAVPPSGNPCNATFDKTCFGDSDCAFAVHQTSCCGDQIAIGFAKSQSEAFSKTEPICRATYPGCGCASRGLTTEEGRPDGGLLLNPADVTVACKAGKCTTSPK